MIDYGALKAWNMAPVIREYTVRDSVIYNLGIGGGVIEDANEAPLEDVWEERLMVAPTMASALCVDTSWHTDARTGISADRAVHGDEAVTIHHPLPRSGRICGLTRVEEVYDKGAGRGALLMLAKELTDPDCGFAYATVRSTIFLRGDGGFGGPTKDLSPPPLPNRPADRLFFQPTRPEQALIYRLSGDIFAIHVDPEFARRVGFDGPILHGLATKGMACRQLVKSLAGGDAARVRRISARFPLPCIRARRSPSKCGIRVRAAPHTAAQLGAKWSLTTASSCMYESEPGSRERRPSAHRPDFTAKIPAIPDRVVVQFGSHAQVIDSRGPVIFAETWDRSAEIVRGLPHLRLLFEISSRTPIIQRMPRALTEQRFLTPPYSIPCKRRSA